MPVFAASHYPRSGAGYKVLKHTTRLIIKMMMMMIMITRMRTISLVI